MKREIEQQLSKLIGTKLQCVGRASNLLWLGLGDVIQISRRGKVEEGTEYAIHVQCTWRITLDNKIIVASRDFYSPNSTWNYNEEFEWDVQGNNRFDERVASLLVSEKQLIVEQVESDMLGGLRLFLSNDYLLEVFPDSSEDDEYSEHWRFFSRKEKSAHLVVSGVGIECV
jgi:hypothetical protein